MNQDVIKCLLENFGVNWTHIGEMQSGYRNKSYRISIGSSELNLIIYKSEAGILDRIKRADCVSEMAAERGLPTRKRYLDKTAVLTSAEGKTCYARLYEYLPGKTIPWEAYSKNHIKLLGQAMSDIHFATRDLGIELSDVADECRQLNEYMREYFSDENVRGALVDKLNLVINPALFELFDKTFDLAQKLPEQIPLHLDLVRGNVLYGDSPSLWQIDDLSLTGVIDFEKTARGSVVFDLARTYAFLLVDCSQKTPEKIYKYLISSGYNKRGKNHIELTGDFAKVFYKLVRFYLFYDFYKFLLHNPYEFLYQNHHFELTKNILLDKNMLKSP